MNVVAWRTRRHERFIVPEAPFGLDEVAPATDPASGRMTLCFRPTSGRPEKLEALREARRAMIREEWTRGLEEGEPALAEAVFSSSLVFWEIPIGEQTRCREKMVALARRANRLLERLPRWAASSSPNL
jgi:hypothetical protein